MNNKEENRDQQQEELIPNSKEKERIEFLDYLRKAKKDREQRKKEGKNMQGVEGTPVRKRFRPDTIIESDEVDPSLVAGEYARAFKKAVEEQEEKSEEETR